MTYHGVMYYNANMGNTVPALSDFKKGQKIVIGDKKTFGIHGTISEIDPEDPYPIKANINIGIEFALALEDFNVTWCLDD